MPTWKENNATTPWKKRNPSKSATSLPSQPFTPKQTVENTIDAAFDSYSVMDSGISPILAMLNLVSADVYPNNYNLHIPFEEETPAATAMKSVFKSFMLEAGKEIRTTVEMVMLVDFIIAVLMGVDEQLVRLEKRAKWPEMAKEEMVETVEKTKNGDVDEEMSKVYGFAQEHDRFVVQNANGRTESGSDVFYT